MVVTIFRNDESASLPTLLKKESTTDILIDQFDKFRNSCFEEHLWELLLKQNAYAHRRTECNDFRFQFPKFRLVRCFILSTQIYVQSAKWKSYWLIEMNTKKALQASAFSFIDLSLAEKGVLHFLLLMLDYIKSTLREKQLITSNAERLKEKSWKP